MRHANENDLIYAIARRVHALADESMPLLRIRAAACMAGRSAAHGTAENADKYSSKGGLIEEIILREFIMDEPREFK